MRYLISGGLILILSLVSLPLSVSAEDAHPKVCLATSMGSPCPQGGVATLGHPQPVENQGIGNPIDLRSGNKYQRETDLPMQPSGLELVRHYNAMDPRTSAIGQGWNWSYDTRIFVTGQQLQVIQADGSRIVFNCVTTPCTASQSLRGKIYPIDNKGWQWHWPTGKELLFDLQGRLIKLTQSTGQTIVIERHPEQSRLSGLIDRISAEQEYLKFMYGVKDVRAIGVSGAPAKLLTVETPQGVFQYAQSRPPAGEKLQRRASLFKNIKPVVVNNRYRLDAMTRPDGMQRIYHYETDLQAGHRYALTGISIGQAASQVRTHSWRYDGQGRANLFVPGQIQAGIDYPTIPFQEIHQVFSGLHIKRDEQGVIRTLISTDPAWPSLKMAFDEEGEIATWQMRGLNKEVWSRKVVDGVKKTMTRRFSPAAAWHWTFDRQQRIVEMDAWQDDGKSTRTQVDWRANQPVIISHPEETQILRYARRSKQPSVVRAREIFRPATPAHAAWSYREQFSYNDDGQRTEHVLPEGGSLHYWWNGNRLLSIVWQDARGMRHRVIDSIAAGIRHGNGLVTSSMKRREGLSDLIVYQPSVRAAIFHQQLEYNRRGAIAAEHIYSNGQLASWNYLRDTHDRLLPAASPMTHTHIQRDQTGLPSRVGQYLLRYNAQRRLSVVRSRLDAQVHVRYGHNAQGERIWREDSVARVHFLFDQKKLVAEVHAFKQKLQITRRFIYAHHVPVAMIENGRDLYWIHTDAVGLPRLVTDAQQRVRWQGHFSAYGALLSQRGDVAMPLRLPGQIADPQTGWHDNYQRTYDPQWGKYLEPDPLGPSPENSLYGYADQQPRRHADPLGLMLFAFDGTGNQASSLTNVWLFSKAYRDGPVHYITGPAADAGMSETEIKTDAAFAWSGGARVDQQWDRLLNAMAQFNEQKQSKQTPTLQKLTGQNIAGQTGIGQSRSGQTTPVPIDIIGFSRGAALARHFGNRIVEHVKDGRFWSHHPLHGVVSNCVDLRFLGLFDTVAQFNVLGAGNAAFNLQIAPAWKWVSHAVALHEHRWLFPLTSAVGPSNVVERAFVGAHADIGGGYLTAQASPGSTPGDLSTIALAWMQWQAQAAGVGVGVLPAWEGITRPFVHDERAPFSRNIQRGDRRVNDADGQKRVNYQADLPRMGQALRREVEAFIQRAPALGTVGADVVGRVDIPGYVAWLKDAMGLDW